MSRFAFAFLLILVFLGYLIPAIGFPMLIVVSAAIGSLTFLSKKDAA